MDRKKARKKATELVSQMTLEEKASQLRYDAPAIKRLGIPAYNWWNEALHGVARAGQATVFPPVSYTHLDVYKRQAYRIIVKTWPTRSLFSFGYHGCCSII